MPIDNEDVLLHLSELEELNLSKNCIQEIPPFICKLGNLKKLNLGYNQLHKLPQEVFGMELSIGCLTLRNAFNKRTPFSSEPFGSHSR